MHDPSQITHHPFELFLRSELAHASAVPTLESLPGFCLYNTDISITFREEGGVISSVSAARLTPDGEEIAALILRFPPLQSDVTLHKAFLSAGLHAKGCVSFDEAMAALEVIGGEFGATITHCIAELGGHEFPARARQSEMTVADPSETKDLLTGLRGKAALYSEAALQDINRTIPGEKMLMFLDFNNMGVANKFGLGDQIDEVLRRLNSVAKESLGDLPFEIFRVGGDELTIVVADHGATTLQAMERFRDSVHHLRDEAFKGHESKVSRAEDFARVRSRARNLFADYVKAQEPGQEFSLGAFRRWICTQCGPGFLPDRQSTGRLAVKLAQRKIAEEGFTGTGVMSFSCASVKIGSDPTPETIAKALGLCDKKIHAQKEGRLDPLTISVSDTSELAEIKTRAATRDAILDVKRTHRRFQYSQQDLDTLRLEADKGASALTRTRAETALRIAAGLDPTVSENVLRYNLVHNMRVNDFAVPGADAWASALILDVNHFGVINNQLGYDRGDELIGKIANAIRDQFPEALIIRKDGGRLVVLTSYGPENHRIQSIWTRAETALREAVHSDLAMAEYQIRVALEALSGQKRSTEHLVLKRVKFEEGVVDGLHEKTFAEVIEQLETNKVRLERVLREDGTGHIRIKRRATRT